MRAWDQSRHHRPGVATGLLASYACIYIVRALNGNGSLVWYAFRRGILSRQPLVRNIFDRRLTPYSSCIFTSIFS